MGMGRGDILVMDMRGEEEGEVAVGGSEEDITLPLVLEGSLEE
jgi:hypothetical protein